MDTEKVYLIPLADAEHISQIEENVYAEGWTNHSDANPVWTTAETLEGLKAIGIQPEILDEHALLPIFHGFGTYIDTADYAAPLTAMCLASNINTLAIAYVGYNCERDLADDLIFHASRFAYYSRKFGRSFLWRAIANQDDADWILALYHNDENLAAWLATIGLPDDA